MSIYENNRLLGSLQIKGVAKTSTKLQQKLAKTGGIMLGVLALGNKKITGVGDPLSCQDVSSKSYVYSVATLKLIKSGDIMSGNINMGWYRIKNLADPVKAQDTVTEQYITN